MGCAATKSQSQSVIEPMLSKPQDANIDENNNKTKNQSTVKTSLKEKDTDSLRGSKASIRSASTASRSDRESSAQSTRTADSGFGGGDCNPFISEQSNLEQQKQANVEQRPETPELVIEGSQVPRRQSGKDRKQVGFLDSLPPIVGQSLVERPQSRAGNLAFDIVLTPNTGNIKRKPPQLPRLEKPPKKEKMTKEELEEKQRKAEERRKQREQKLVAKSQSLREHQLRSALQYGRSQEVSEEDTDF